DDPEVDDYIHRHGITLNDGELIEMHPGFAEWIERASQRLNRGYGLIIDYGYPADQFFAEHRRAGTLKAYYQHGVSTETYRGIGKQDLTAHINFSEVEWHARQRGFSQLGLTTQADLLGALGIGDRLVHLRTNPALSSDDYLSVRAAVLRMIDPGAMGRFRALFLGRNVASERVPAGLR
ncbi:MAG: SAM-dependent methyltransferase, partial [Thermomicrobiaceae bacterium]